MARVQGQVPGLSNMGGPQQHQEARVREVRLPRPVDRKAGADSPAIRAIHNPQRSLGVSNMAEGSQAVHKGYCHKTP